MISGILIVLSIFVYIHTYFQKVNLDIAAKAIDKSLETKRDEVIKVYDDNEKIFNTYKNYCQNKIFELSLVVLQLKLHEEKLLTTMDPIFDNDNYLMLSKSIHDLDEFLKEIALLSPSAAKIDIIESSILKTLYKDSVTDYFKN